MENRIAMISKNIIQFICIALKWAVVTHHYFLACVTANLHPISAIKCETEFK